MNKPKTLNLIGDAVLSDDAINLIASLQDHDNDNLNGWIMCILQSVSFMARCLDQADEKARQRITGLITELSNISEQMEVLQK